MQTSLRKVFFELVEIKDEEFLPETIEPNKFYFVKWLNGSSHLCPCGCGEEVYLPMKEGEWNLIINNGKISVSPSVLKRLGCKSHYVFQNGFANIL